jgi:hypothetical protein
LQKAIDFNFSLKLFIGNAAAISQIRKMDRRNGKHFKVAQVKHVLVHLKRNFLKQILKIVLLALDSNHFVGIAQEQLLRRS